MDNQKGVLLVVDFKKKERKSSFPAITEHHVLSSLNWRSGQNRSTGYCQIEAEDDIAAIGAWLALFVRSPQTASNYRKDAIRLLYWCVTYARKPVSALQHEDFLRYREWLLNPPPESVGHAGTSAPMTPGWKPLRGPLSPISLSQTFSTLRAMFAFLVQAGYLKTNPILLSMRSVARPKHEKTRKPLSKEVVEALFTGIEELHNAAEKVLAAWVFRFLLATGVRITEAINARAGDIYQEDDCWYIRVIGKGQKERSVVFPEGLFPYWNAVYAAVGFDGSISPSEIPLIFTAIEGPRRGGAPVKRQTLHAWLKRKAAKISDSIADRMIADKVKGVHAHLFRHTAATEWIANGVTLPEARDNLGHGSLATLGIYVHPELKSRHKSISKATNI